MLEFFLLLNTYPRLSSKTLGEIHTVKHKISLRNKSKIHAKRPYQIPLALVPQVKQEVNKLVNECVLRKSNSPYASPAFVVPKAKGIKLVGDFRQLTIYLMT